MPEYQTMTEMAASKLRRAIMRGDLRPGTRLIPNKLEGELNLSRVAIREAIRELSGSGLVETVTHVGAHVASPPSIEELKEIFEIRLLLEPKMTVMASRTITDNDLEILQNLCCDMERMSPPFKEFFFLNRRFHQIIHHLSGWTFLCGIVSQFMDQILIYRSLRLKETNLDLKATNLEHRQLMEKIQHGDSKEIKHIVKTHIQRGLDDVIRMSRDEVLSEGKRSMG
jgi:DNA-binding GntR family transcriptional regulator